jgi:sigma-B regulation protein RsbU (phosphoserine phosphatase)
MSHSSTHVLLIEDNPGDADLVRLRLIESDPTVDVNCVSRLADGLESLKHKSPSLVLLDLNLPDSHGAETFRKVLEKAPGVPVVILSGQDDQGLAIKALHQGVQDYLLKGGLTSSDLDRAMRYAVERQALLQSLEISRKQQLEFKNQFLSHVSHELRTPLTCIHQYVTILSDGLAGEMTHEQQAHLGTILKSVNQLNAMVRDLLQAARAESGKIVLERRCVSIEELIRLAVQMMQATGTQKRVGLEVGVETGMPFVYGDPDRILEVLINLIDNAIKFTPADGAVTVSAGRVPTDPDFACVSVTDTGSGIAPESRALIFERLYQDPNAVDNNRKGLGLGLYISKELVALHGGRIWAASDGASGSTFSFTLPLYSPAKLLFPVITHQNELRPAICLIQIDLKPRAKPQRGPWREICKHTREVLERCVYLDKDLVLPFVGPAGQEQTLFVVASTDLENSGIMVARIREQFEKLEELKAASFDIRVCDVSLPGHAPEISLEQRVQAVADRVTVLTQTAMGIGVSVSGSFDSNLKGGPCHDVSKNTYR